MLKVAVNYHRGSCEGPTGRCMSRTWASVRYVTDKCSINIRYRHSSWGMLSTGRHLYCALGKVPLALTATFSITSYHEPAPKVDIPWAICFPSVHILTTTLEKPLGEAYT